MSFFARTILLCSLPCFPLLLDAQPDTARIAAAFREVTKKHDIPAASMSIVFHDETYFFNHGKLDRNPASQAVDHQSLYQIASLGKPLVGIIFQRLFLAGVVTPEQAITDFLDERLSSKRRNKLAQVSLRHLLHHNGGLPQDARAAYRRKDGTAYQYDYQEEDLYLDLNKVRLKPTGNYQYSNFGYALLAYVATKVTGKSYHDVLAKTMGDELGWSVTGLEVPTEQRNQLTTPYRKDDRRQETGYWKMGIMAPPSGLYSNVHEFTILLRHQLAAYRQYAKDGKVNQWILTDSTSPKSGLEYGYGMNVYPGGYFGHSGDMDGYAVDYSFNPDKNFGIVLMTSSGEDWINPFIRRVNRILAKE